MDFNYSTAYEDMDHMEREHLGASGRSSVQSTVDDIYQQFNQANEEPKVFIGGLPNSLTKEHLEDYFSDLCNEMGSGGRVINVRRIEDRGFAFVTFDTIDVVNRILESR